MAKNWLKKLKAAADSHHHPVHYIVATPINEAAFFKCANHYSQRLGGYGCNQLACASFDEGKAAMMDYLKRDIEDKIVQLELMEVLEEKDLLHSED